MVEQVQILPDPSAPIQSKGDFFEELLRLVMETQRYRVTDRVNFTGTEIDLLCEHMDRRNDTALVECKARVVVDSTDIKVFSFNVVVDQKAKYGFFVHTSELHHQAAGLAHELKAKSDNLTFWGPHKVTELLLHAGAISDAPKLTLGPQLVPSKRILLYAYFGRFWLTILSNQIIPTHYHVSSASDSHVTTEALKLISDLEEVKNLTRWEDSVSRRTPDPNQALDGVAEIQEAEQWDDYRPVGSKFFVGRKGVRDKLYSFLQGPNEGTTNRRVFFIESKSGWGKSSLIAELRARSRNQRNKNWLFAMAVDSRTANTGAFVGLAFAKMIAAARSAGFLPSEFAQVTVASMYDTLASAGVKSVLRWLRENRKVLVIVFDQFEDMFRKADLFQAFHKFMLDVNAENGNLIVGFSWKSEINVPIDNPAYSLWQQARDLAEPFSVEEFLDGDVNRVLRQLEDESSEVLPGDLKRKLSESSQGFPWLIKRLAIHCYHQLNKGIRPEELVDQNLKVDFLMKEDEESLEKDELTSLRLIARRGYEGDPFDVAEVDELVTGLVVQSLINKRLIVKSGTKYNVYWDVFRDYLVENRIPTIGESFLLRQFPSPCVKTLELLLSKRAATLNEVLDLSPGLKEGTALNRLRELRYLGAITKGHDDRYTVRQNLNSLEDFKEFIHERLQEHVLTRALLKPEGDTISHEDVEAALKLVFKRYSFGSKTWGTYASYFISWYRYAGLDFGRRLRFVAALRGLDVFIPQWRPDKDCDVFFSFRGGEGVTRSKPLEKPLYDLRSLGMIEYDGPLATLTKRGANVLKLDDTGARKEIAKAALELPKILQAVEAYTDPSSDFDLGIMPALASIPSDSYRKVARAVLKSWARFIERESGISQTMLAFK